jgi:hypothetical protein
MTKLELKQLIKAISDWQILTPVQLFNILKEKNIHYIDPKMYRLTEIAKFIGGDNMSAFLTLVKQAGYEWMITEAASGVYLGDPSVNSRLRALNHPIAIALANHTNRMISILEQAGIDSNELEIVDAKAELLHEERQNNLRITGASRWNAYAAAVDRLTFDDEDPVL